MAHNEWKSDQLGPVLVGSIPEPAKMTFKQPGGQDAIDLTNFTAVEVEFVKPSGQKDTRAGEFLSKEEGKVRYVFQSGDLDEPGHYKLLFWAISGSPATTKLPSKIMEIDVVVNPLESQS